jgi:adenine-specific DNA-methyltransferase
MARIDDLISQITDKGIRQRLESALLDMKRRQRFGLVFEEHIPETTALFGFPVTIGSTVQRRSDPEGKQLFRVKNIHGNGRATLEPEAAASEPEQEAAKELMVVKRFGDPIFPALTPIGSIL